MTLNVNYQIAFKGKQFLLQNSVTTNPTKYFYVNNPIFMVVMLGYVGLLDLFFEKGARIDLQNSQLGSLTEFAVASGQLSCLQYLLDRFGYDELTKYCANPLLCYIASRSNYDALALVLEHRSFNLLRHNIPDRYKQTALHIASFNGDDNSVALLLRKGASFLKDGLNRTAFEVALSSLTRDIYPIPDEYASNIAVMARRDYHATLQVLLESGEVNPLFCQYSTVINAPARSSSVLGFLPVYTSIPKRDLLLKVYVLLLSHGAGLESRHLSEIRKFFVLPDTAKCCVFSKTGEAFYSLNVLESHLRENPDNFHLKSLENACRSESVIDSPAVQKLLKTIQSLEAIVAPASKNVQIEYEEYNNKIQAFLNISFKKMTEQNAEDSLSNLNRALQYHQERTNILWESIEAQSGQNKIQKDSYFYIIMSAIEIFSTLCEQKSIIVSQSFADFENKAQMIKVHLKKYIDNFHLFFNAVELFFVNEKKNIVLFHQAVIYGLQF